jgi:hypothetical protein
MSLSNDNQQNALIDALKYTSDVVSALTIKINTQDDDIFFLKNKLNLMEEQVNKIFKKLTIINANAKNYSNVELNTEDEQDDNNKTNYKNDSHDSHDSNDSHDSDDSHDSKKNNSQESNDELKLKNFEITSIGDTDINKFKKIKVNQMVDKLIQKKKEINNFIEKKLEEKKIDVIQEEVKKMDDVVVTRRRNNIMRRF